MLISDAVRVFLQDSVSGAWLVVPLVLDATLRAWADVARFPWVHGARDDHRELHVPCLGGCGGSVHQVRTWPFSQRLDYPNFQMGVTPQPVRVGRRSSSRLKAGSKFNWQGVVPTPCGQWKLVKLPSANTGSGGVKKGCSQS